MAHGNILIIVVPAKGEKRGSGRREVDIANTVTQPAVVLAHDRHAVNVAIILDNAGALAVRANTEIVIFELGAVCVLCVHQTSISKTTAVSIVMCFFLRLTVGLFFDTVEDMEIIKRIRDPESDDYQPQRVVVELDPDDAAKLAAMVEHSGGTQAYVLRTCIRYVYSAQFAGKE